MLSTVLLAALAVLGPTSAAPIKRAVNGPVIDTDFPDPSVIKVGDTWYAFGSQSVYDNKNIHIQIATSTDFATWTLSQGADALPNVPSWAIDDGNVWAPDVNQLVRTPPTF